MPITVTYQSLGRSQRTWQARFELGSDDANQEAALHHAWTHNARILRDGDNGGPALAA